MNPFDQARSLATPEARASIDLIVRKGRPLAVPAERFLDDLIPVLRELDEGAD